MTSDSETSEAVLKLGPRITLLPVIHGSGDFAIEVRRRMLVDRFDCLAVPLPPSFQEPVETGVEQLPALSVVVQPQSSSFDLPGDFSTGTEWSESDDDDDDDEEEPERRMGTASYVPIDPCQPVIAALRIALQERMARAYIDIETDDYLPVTAGFPDPYALKKVSLEQFAAAVLPAIPRPTEPAHIRRILWQADQLRNLQIDYRNILCICQLTDWPWIRDAFQSADRPNPEQPGPFEPPKRYPVTRRTTMFMLGELPWITGEYELARSQLDDDENLSIDGVKSLLLSARDRYEAEFGNRARRITPNLLRTCLKYARNLSLIHRCFTPDLYTLVTAARQTAGDQFAIHVAELSRDYPFDAKGKFRPLSTPGTLDPATDDLPENNDPHLAARFGVDRIGLFDGRVFEAVSRLPTRPIVWRSMQLLTRPERKRVIEWQRSWNPFGQCSWPPEDVSIERFRTHVKDVALELLGNDLAKTEKFSASLKDGLDIRETLRNWHTGELYVRLYPPARGRIDSVIMLFDSPADPRDYPWRITWHAEHHDESTLSFFATDFHQDIVGPGIAMARYGGNMFLFPPRPVPNIWTDPTFHFCDTLEERLIASACFHSNERHIALMSAGPPGAGWRRLAKHFGKKLIHVPLSRFGAETIEKLRIFHVLNGKNVRSFAADFIRRP